MCGIIGIVSDAPVNEPLFEGLTVLQHRGQDAAGIATADSSRLYMRKSNGLVRDVFRARHLTKLMGNMGIGHVRYPTAGSSSLAEAQPLYVNSPYGIALGHNGNLTNTQQLREQLESGELRHLNTDSDSEVLLNVLAGELHKEGQPRISHD
ncbi:MAG: amidophosphoribosyltransferase, partial [Gammaproteobacteria bacterium]